jgi:LacI family transcriptional regulator
LCILDACRRADVAVPEQVAVIAADNDDVICDLSDPPLTSVPHNLDRIGFEAAAMLDQLMSGEASPAGPKLIAPLQVVRRQSTDIVAISDPDIVAAMRYIREHACDPVEVTDVAREVRLSRRVLERRFGKHLGHSPHAEIVRVRLERVRELLLATDLPLVAVAQKAGFSYAAYLNVAFKKRFGQTPGAFRASVAATNGRN